MPSKILRHLAALLFALLAGCGAGLEEPDPRPLLPQNECPKNQNACPPPPFRD